MIPDDRLDPILLDFRDGAVPDGPPPDVASRTLAALRAGRSRRARPSPLERIAMMPPLLLKIAAGLLVAAGTTGLLGFFNAGPKDANAAFAEALEHVKAARSVAYTMRVGDDPNPFRVFWKEPGLTRTEIPGGTITILDAARGKSLNLWPDSKIAMLAGAKGGAAQDPIDSLRKFKGEPEANLGDREIGGRPARGYRLAAGGWESAVWVDRLTNLPIRMETTINPGAAGAVKVVYGDFVFDAALDESLFSLTPPAGYQVRTIPVAAIAALVAAAGVPGEKNLVELLGDYARRMDGRFPVDLTMSTLLEALKMSKEREAELDEAVLKGVELDEATKAWLVKAARGIGLVWAMPTDSDALYTGKGVELGQGDRPVFRYRPRGIRMYRVIFGDLTVKDVEPDQISRPSP